MKRRASRWANRFRRKGIIMVYHHIATVSHDPWGIAVTEKNFAEQLGILKSYADPIPLKTMMGARSDSDLPPRPVSITFDDGYIDNFTVAAPLLSNLRIPGTMFLTTGYSGMTREYWWDALEQLVFGFGSCPTSLDFEVKGQRMSWTYEGVAERRSGGQDSRGWRAWEPATGPRESLYQWLYNLLARLPMKEKDSVLDQLQEHSGVHAIVRPGSRTGSEEEVRALALNDYVEIGAHTVTHPVLSSISPNEQRQEIEGSRASLERLIGRPVESFAYPYGKRMHYSKTTTALLRDLGFQCGCSNYWGVVTTSTNRFELPRIQALDCGGDEFRKELETWFQG
jgi:peptidoglycan/xylan/chitin deacetylase (PgdA/CDA1 family)